MNIEKVVQNSRCKSCGYCFFYMPVSAIDMIYADGFFRTEVNTSQCVQCGKCVKCCPVENEFAEAGLLGSYIKLQLAHSAGCKVRHNATSGGVINSLVRFLLKEQIVDGVLMAGYDSRSINETSSQLITLNELHVLEGKTRDYASKYVLTPVLTGLQNIPKKNQEVGCCRNSLPDSGIEIGG